MPTDLSPEATVSEPGTPPPSGPRAADGAGPSAPGARPSAGRRWTAGRVTALVAGSLLLVASGALFGAGLVLTWAVVLDADSPTLSWLAGELLAAAVMVGVLAAALIVIPIRMATARD